MSLPVELISNGKKVRAVSQDISPLGMFVRTNVSRSPTVFCEYPSQNGVPTS